MMKKTDIRFGTDGWRAEMGKDFTFQNVQLVTQALVDYLLQQGNTQAGIAVGYDNRFLSEDFARVAAEVCSGAGIKTYLTSHSVPSPVLSLAVKKMNLCSGIMITASHNPPAWNGFKIKEAFGGSALPETTRAVEAKLSDELVIQPDDRKLEIFDPNPLYFEQIKSLVDFELLRSPDLKLLVDAMHGSGAGYFKALGLPVTEIRGNRDPLFGGVNPEPVPVNLEESLSYVKETALKYTSELTGCIVLDGDADRLAAIDSSGRFINTHNVFCLLLYHLVVHRKMTGNVVKTFNLTRLIDKMCAKYDRQLHVTPIGFKHVADLMLKEDILLGGEESGGMGIKGFIPERDGILAGLMLWELMAYSKKTLAQILDDLMDEHGYFYYERADLHTTRGRELVDNLKKSPPEIFAGRKVSQVETLDGLKLNFENESWILFRASGTEPLVRVYVEGRTPNEVRLLLAEGEKLASVPAL